MLKYTSALLCTALLLAACASKHPQDAKSGSSADDSKGGADGKNWADAQRETFMNTCLAKVKAPDYCSCGFDQFREVFKDGPGDDNSKAPDPRLSTLAERTKSECASKLPEDIVKASFVNSCAEDDKRKAAYCECAWPALRKNLALSDFATDFEGPRFDAAKKSMAAACKGKFPTDVAKAEFLKGCTKDDTAKAKPCECIWKKLKGKFSTEEIVSGSVDLESVNISECKP
jgi:hypothetical protein